MKLTHHQRDRAVGAVVAPAVGDALGAPYEFQPPVPADEPISWRAGGGWELGEWTDDTAMAIPLLHAVARGADLADEAVQDDIVTTWIGWMREAKDVGNQTRAVLSAVARGAGDEGPAAASRTASRRLHEQSGRSGGNGTLMRTGPVALGYLEDPSGLAEAARAISDLTHFDPDAGDACVIWSLGIRHAIVMGELDLEVGVAALPFDRRDLWRERIADAEQRMPWEIASNGWVVAALQAAWSAIVHASSLTETLELAVRSGYDTDTVAAIAGSLAGAVYGYSAIPWDWRRDLHGWPATRDAGALTDRDLMAWAIAAAEGGTAAVGTLHDGAVGVDDPRSALARRFTPYEWSHTFVQHPHDEGVWLGDLNQLEALPEGIDAVVSLCRVGVDQRPVAARDHAEIWLVDRDDANLDVEFVLRDAAAAVATLRAEGRTVLLHCHAAQSRTPSVGAAYSVLYRGVPAARALPEVEAALPSAWAAPWFRGVVEGLA